MRRPSALSASRARWRVRRNHCRRVARLAAANVRRIAITPAMTSRMLGHYNSSVIYPADSIARAYAACESLARSHYENFPVASRLLPRAMRPHVAAVYAFARTADDMADEGVATPADRQARLERWRRRLHEAVG